MEESLSNSLFDYDTLYDASRTNLGSEEVRSSLAVCRWSAELQKFPEKLDIRPIVEVFFGTSFAVRYMKFVVHNINAFIAVGILIHVIGIGSISGYNNGLRELSGGLSYSVWTYMTPFAIIWHVGLLLTMNYGLFKIVVIQFKPAYIMVNATIFSIAITSYLWSERAWFEIPAKFFDICAFSGIVFSDAFPRRVRLPFCRYFLPVFIALYGLVFIPKLALNLDSPPNGHGHIRNIYVGNLKIAQNTTVGVQVLINMLIWFCYISWNSFHYPDSFCLLLARVTRPKTVNEKEETFC